MEKINRNVVGEHDFQILANISVDLIESD